MLQQLRIGTRLAIGFGGVIAAAVAAFAAAVFVGQQGQQATESVNLVAGERVGLVQSMRESQLRLASTIRSTGLQSDPAGINADVERFKAITKQLVASEEQFMKGSLSAEERGVLDRINGLRRQAETVADEAIKLAMSLAGEEAAKVLTQKFAPVEQEWSRQLADLTRLQHERAAAAKAGIASNNQRSMAVLGALLTAVLCGGVTFAVAMTRSVTRPLRQASDAAKRIAEGDLSVSIQASGDDEVSQLLRTLAAMAQQLSMMVGAVRESAESIDLASREIAQGNVDLSQRTELQAASLQQTSTSLGDLTRMVSQTSGNAQTARQLVEKTAGIAGQGGSAMEDVAQTMSRISDSSRRIAEIIGVIDGIAFQTNILALNAAVEAARAGEQGRGFAVVASEVRALAHRVTGAAKEVRGLIQESVGRVDDGARQIGGLGDTMRDLVGSVGKVSDLIGDISAASGQQNQSLGQVNDSVRSIDGSTQQNSALVEQVAAAAQSLSGQTERLTGLTRRFRIAA